MLQGMVAFYGVRGESIIALELGEQLLSLAHKAHDAGLLLEAHLAQGYTLVVLGEFEQARVHLESGSALYDTQKHRSHAFLYGQDPGVACLYFSSYLLWLFGYPDQALTKISHARALAQELSHPYTLAMTLFHSGSLHHLRREADLSEEYAEACMRLSTERGFPLISALNFLVQGRALSERRKRTELVPQMQKVVTDLQAMGVTSWTSFLWILLAEVLEKTGQAYQGIAVLTEALVLASQTGDRWFEAELYRLKGELTLQQWKVESQKSKEEEAEACFLKAIDIARQQQAKSWELRAAISLARLWQQQGKRAEAHKLLSDVYNWFTEGFDTKDLQEAKALIEELGYC
jgi:predicted ATPase